MQLTSRLSASIGAVDWPIGRIDWTARSAAAMLVGCLLGFFSVYSEVCRCLSHCSSPRLPRWPNRSSPAPSADPQNAVVVGAQVTLAAGANELRTVQTDAQGRYRFEAVPAGTYTVVVASPGFQTATSAGHRGDCWSWSHPRT